MRTSFTTFSRLLFSLLFAVQFALNGMAQSRIPALDSMGLHMGRQNWKAAMEWALKAAEADPKERNWRYLNAAIFASRDRNRELALHYATLVVNSEIITQAGYQNNFDWLRDDPEWRALMHKVDARKEQERQEKIKASLPFRAYQQELSLQAAQYVDSLSQIRSPAALYQAIRENRPAHQYTRYGRYVYAWVKLADTLEFPYLIQLPSNFDPGKQHPLVVVLHGAVGRQSKIPDVPDSTTAHVPFGKMFMQKAGESGFIAVFPNSNKQYNWMMPDDGFGLVPELVRQVKHLYSIDDSRVYVTGHSNGATGAFSYLMKQPGLFAGFSGLNNRPQVRTGGTFFRNAVNRSFYNVATDYDYYFPLEGHRAVTGLAQKLGIDWQNQEITGHRSHGYLMNAKDSTAHQVYGQLFDYMSAQTRNPFRNSLYWECDDTKHGRCDWLEIVKLDTAMRAATWQSPVNAVVTGWRDMMKPEVMLDSTSQAFEFPRQSGAVQATYAGNRFELKTSRVGKIRIYLSPEMIDLKQNVRVVINGRTVFNGPVEMDRAFILNQYRREMDQQAVWVNALELTVP
nr:hypothetical protein [uncultured Dyadobacter sp.]